MLLLMGNAFSSFIADECPENFVLTIYALFTRLVAISKSMDNLSDDYVKRVAKEALTLIDERCGDITSPLDIPLVLLKTKLMACYLLGDIARRRGNADLAIKYYQEYEKVLLTLSVRDDDYQLIHIKVKIAEAEGLLPGGCKKRSNEFILRLREMMYKDVRENGSSSYEIIYSGIAFAVALMNVNKFEEAKNLLTDEIYPLSKQEHGKDHPNTQRIRAFLRECWKEILHIRRN